MAASNKTSTTRTPGRTPPFILIGLLLLLGFLGYNYYALSTSNADLVFQLENVKVQKKDVDALHFETEKKLAKAREELTEAQEKLRQVQESLTNKDSELAKLKTELSNQKPEIEKIQKQANECSASLEEQKKAVETAKHEKDDVANQLQKLKDTPLVCDASSCTDHLKNVLTVVAKLTGSEALGKALNDNNLNAAKLLEGINFPAPAAKQDGGQGANADKAEKESQPEHAAGEKNEADVTAKTVDASPSSGTDVQNETNNNEIDKDTNVTAKNVDASPSSGSDMQNETFNNEIDKDTNVAAIKKQMTDLESERRDKTSGEDKLGKEVDVDDKAKKEPAQSSQEARADNRAGNSKEAKNAEDDQTEPGNSL